MQRLVQAASADCWRRAASSSGLPPWHPLFASSLQPLAYLQQQQRVHAALAAPDTWQLSRLQHGERQVLSPNCRLSAGLLPRMPWQRVPEALQISRVSDGAVLATLHGPEGFES